MIKRPMSGYYRGLPLEFVDEELALLLVHRRRGEGDRRVGGVGRQSVTQIFQHAIDGDDLAHVANAATLLLLKI